MQRSLIVGGGVDLGGEVSVDVHPEVAGGPLPGARPTCGPVHYTKVMSEPCKNTEGIGSMKITYSCWNTEVPRLNGNGWECYGDPATEVCVDYAWGDCVVPDPPQTAPGF